MTLGKKNHGKDDRVKNIMRKLDADGDGTITANEFKAKERSVPNLMLGPFTMQQKMQKMVLGKSFWEKQAAERKKWGKGRDLIELQYELEHSGKRLDRKAEAKRGREHLKTLEGVVWWEDCGEKTVVPLYAAPDLSSKRTGKLKVKSGVDILEAKETESVDPADKAKKAVKEKWYQMDEDRDGVKHWIQAKFVKIDHTWDKAEARDDRLEAIQQDDKDTKARNKKEAEQRRLKVEAEWLESVDKEGGRSSTYWYNQVNGKTTRKNPLKGKYALWKKKNLPLEATHEEFMQEPSAPVLG